jgi:acyl transferase domain-containing protein
LQAGRKAFAHRRVLVCRDRKDAIHALMSLDGQRVLSSDALNGDTFQQEMESDRLIIFMFSGQGSQYVNMGRNLYETEPIFRNWIDRGCEFLQPILDTDLRNIIYPDRNQPENSSIALNQTVYAQPALFLVEYALAQVWMAWGIRPRAMIGHSIGEYVAACLAGVFSFEDALMLVASRGQLMQSLPSGKMLSVSLSVDDVQPFLSSNLSLAVINSPSLCAVSGTEAAIASLITKLDHQGIAHRQLHTSHAFHSSMMEPILNTFQHQVSQVQRHVPTIPYLSNVTGTWIQPEQATDPQYWANHLRQTVCFADGIATLQQGSNSLFLEIGPGQTLSTLAQANGVEQAQTLTSLRHPRDLRSATESNHQSDRAFLLQTLGQLWLAGISVNWKAVHAPHLRYRVPLPSYPFEHQPYWIDPIKQHSRTQDITKQQTVRIQKQSDMADWFYIPSWKRSPVLPQVSSPKQLTDHSTWLVFTDDSLGQYLSTQLRKVNHTVIEVQPGHQFNQLNETLYTLRPDQKQDYNALITSLQQREIFPNSIVHLWNCYSIANVSAGDRFQHAQTFGLYSLLHLTQALIAQDDTTPVTITVVTQGIHDITGNEILKPEQATILGLCRVISQEHSYISYRSLDLDQLDRDEFDRDQVDPDQSNTISSRWMESILTELIVSSADPIVAFRNGRRWTQTIEPFPFSQSVDVPQLRQGGVYLITGGLGDTSLTIAEYLAKTAQAKLVLLDHPDTPPRDEWGQGKLQNLETLGSGVLQIRADVADLEQMQAVMQQIEAQFGTLHGVIYAAETTAEQSFQPISRTTTTDCQWHFQPKAQGLLVLAQVLQGRSLDFCIVHSSIASLIGGFVAHTAANCFVDAFVQQQNRISAFPWLSINWEGWQFWQERQMVSPSGTTADWALLPQEGLEVFQQVLALTTMIHLETSQIIISTVDLPGRLAQLDRVNQKDSDTAQSNVETHYHPRPELHTDYDAPRNDIERTITTIWQNLLGIERIGIYDSFFQLGGHSLLAVQITSRLRETFQVEIPLRSLLLDTPTIAGLAEVVAAYQSQTHESSDSDAMTQLLAEIEGLSPADVQAQLAHEPNIRH